MPYTKEALQNMYSLSPEDVLATLTACGLSHDTQEYSDTDIETRFDMVRQLFKDGQASDYEQATTLFQQNLEDDSSPELPENKNGRKKSRKKLSKPLDITELLSYAREQGFKLTLTKALQIFASCGLKEQDEYTPEETERFLAACNLVGQGKTEIEIAANLGISELDAADIQLTFEETQLLIESGGDQLFGEILREKAGQHAAIAPVLYLKYLAQEMGTESSRQSWQNLLGMIKARAVGKPRPQFTSKVQVLQQQLQLNSLPPNSENGSTSD
ncbi:hypothetical protein [Nostoc sp. TCL26-01]|uniref:hypothetical protein n=1 Tax=Nostoc sp. TCL26-01 TaxID=2576904 RepID=UPI0015B94CEB|nr:hypothetical protein [Nostoc sp. TCL26-01]QLE59711.1 hypothetical protein FD725_30195 [Nostoc sp. TCL26-01]